MLILCVLFLFGCSSSSGGPMYYQDSDKVTYEIEGKITNEKDAELAVKVIEDSLKYAQEEDIDEYLNTIALSGREQTYKELSEFFALYDLEHTLLSAEVIEQTEDEIKISASQQTIVVETAEGADEYRNHISEITYLLILEDDKWRINESMTTDIMFL